MVPDHRTLALSLAAATVLAALATAFGVRSRAPGLGRWLASLALLALGSLLAGLRGTVMPALGVALADALILAGLAWQVGALRELAGRTVSTFLLFVPGAMLFLALLSLLQHPAMVAGLTAVALALALTELARAWIGQEAAGGLRWGVAGLSYLATVAVLLVGIDAGLGAAGHARIGAEATLRAAALACFFAVVVAASAGFLVLLRAEVEARLERMTSRDALTGLYNRHEFTELAARELARASRSGVPFVLVRADLGPGADDAVLAAAGRTLSDKLRADDFAGRWGDELGIFLSGASRDTAPVVAERIRAALEASVGAAVCEAGSMKLEEAFALAEDALHDAKLAGGSTVGLRIGGAPGKRPIPRRRVVHRPEEPLLR